MSSGRAEQLMRRSARTEVFGAVVLLAFVLHISLAVGLTRIADYLAAKRAVPPPSMTAEVEIQRPPPPVPQAPELEPERPAPRVARVEPAHAPPPPPPEPTRAAPVMTVAEEFSNDSTESVAVGDNVNATGDTSSNGVVHSHGVQNARIGGTENDTGREPVVERAAPAAVDYSERARIECDEDALRDAFPAAGHEAGITEMDVRIRVTVNAQGHVTNATALNDPGFGFAAAALRSVRSTGACRVRPARDREGNAVADTVQSFRFNFVAE